MALFSGTLLNTDLDPFGANTGGCIDNTIEHI